MRSDLVLNILSYTREIVITCTFIFILYSQSIHVVYFTLSAIVATLVAKFLKRIIKQPRPSSTKHDKKRKKTSYGMPSSHSTAVAFFAAYLQCAVLGSPPTWIKCMLMALFHCFSLSVIWSRVSLGHHTRAQVVAGTLLGIALAVVSYLLWVYCFSNCLPRIVSGIPILKDVLH